MILVVGATGLLGTRICERLRADGRPVRALIRKTSNPGKVQALRSLGCELIVGDLKNPPQIYSACQGISAVISTASATLSVLHSVASRSVLAVGGPEALTPLEVVKIFEEESGRRFEVEKVPETKLQEQLDSANDSFEKSFAGLMLQYAHGDAIDMRGLLQSIPVHLTSAREYARAVIEPNKRASADAPTLSV